MRAPFAIDLEENDSLLRITLNHPPGNVIGSEMAQSLGSVVAGASEDPNLRAVLITATGPHFSFGASVEEHRPDRIQRMLGSFHRLMRAILESRKVFLVAVHGQCLGGGLELALVGHRIFAAPGARLGNPEIKLGVFAPLSSAVLPLRIGQAKADDLLLTGRSVEAEEALSIGLVDAIASDPEVMALDWYRRYLAPHSAAALGHAVRAARRHFVREALASLEELERHYLEELMLTRDSVLGIESFLAKTAPVWTNR